MIPEAALYATQHRHLDRCVRGDWRDQAARDLRTYFHNVRSDGFYSGSRFERFDGGGDALAVRDRITSSDVLALSFLNISSNLPALAIDTMETYADRITELLTAIPDDLPMHAADWSQLAPGAPAADLWGLLRRCGGKDRWVMANKLLARKRPHLLPVYDREVRRLLGAPDNSWACLWSWFAADDGRQAALVELRSEVGGIEDISLLRCLDVVLWMRATRS